MDIHNYIVEFEAFWDQRMFVILKLKFSMGLLQYAFNEGFFNTEFHYTEDLIGNQISTYQDSTVKSCPQLCQYLQNDGVTISLDGKEGSDSRKVLSPVLIE